MRHTLFFAMVLVGSFVMEAVGQQRSIPVYPGAKLETEQQENGECCDFITTDAFDKVIAFYEKQLNTKALDTKAVAAAYPALKQQLQMMEQQLPPYAKLRAFVLEELTINGQKMPNFFEVIGAGGFVRFSIGDVALTGNDAQFAKQWREKTGKTTEEEKMQKQADQQQVEEDKELKEREARKAKEMPEYIAKMTAELSKFLKEKKVELSPGLQCEEVQYYEGESTSGFAFMYASPDDFKKAYGFYAARNKSGTTDNQGGTETSWTNQATVYSWMHGELMLGESMNLEVREVSVTKDGPKKTYVTLRVWEPGVMEKMRTIAKDYQLRW